MARKLRNKKSDSASSSNKQSRRHTFARRRSSAHSKNRGNDQQRSLSTQDFSSRSKNAGDRSLQIPASIHRARENAPRKRSLALLSDLRARKGPYTKLLRDYHLDTRTAHKYLRTALRIGPGGRVHASKSDRLMRELLFPLSSGDVPTRIRGSNAATKLSGFFHDRDKLLGNKMSAEEFETKWRGVYVAGQEVFADAATIFSRADEGDLKVDNLYASVGGAE